MINRNIKKTNKNQNDFFLKFAYKKIKNFFFGFNFFIINFVKQSFSNIHNNLKLSYGIEPLELSLS